MTSFHLILGGTSCTLCGTEVSPSRAGGFHAPITETHSLEIRLPASHHQSTPVTSFVRVIRAVTSLWRGKLVARKLERGGPVFGARSLATLFSSHKGPLRLIQNFCRRFGSGKPSLCVAFIDHCREPFDRIANWFVVSPVLSSVPAVHGQTMQQKDGRDHGKSTRKYG